MYKLIDGKVISKQIKDELKEKVAGTQGRGRRDMPCCHSGRK